MKLNEIKEEARFLVFLSERLYFGLAAPIDTRGVVLHTLHLSGNSSIRSAHRRSNTPPNLLRTLQTIDRIARWL
jgi:hypothetical protein